MEPLPTLTPSLFISFAFFLFVCLFVSLFVSLFLVCLFVCLFLCFFLSFFCCFYISFFPSFFFLSFFLSFFLYLLFLTCNLFPVSLPLSLYLCFPHFLLSFFLFLLSLSFSSFPTREKTRAPPVVSPLHTSVLYYNTYMYLQVCCITIHICTYKSVILQYIYVTEWPVALQDLTRR